MSIQTELARITNAKTAIKTAIEGKGVTVPDGTMLDGMAALIEAIQAGGGGTSVEDGLIDGTITECINNRVTNVRIFAFQGLKKLAKVDLPAATIINDYAFNGCTALTTVDLYAATSIGDRAFYNCKKLNSMIIRSETMCTLSNTNAFTNTPGSSYIYVPSALLESYRAATNWSTYAARFRAIEDYPGI